MMMRDKTYHTQSSECLAGTGYMKAKLFGCRLKVDIQIGLPDKHVYVVFAGLTEEQLKYVSSACEPFNAHALNVRELLSCA
jgi:hypothetical protein